MITAFLILVNMKMSYFFVRILWTTLSKHQYFDLYKVKNGNGLAQEIHINTRKTEKKNHSSSKIKFDDSLWFDIIIT
jgi:hypothetical protein